MAERLDDDASCSVQTEATAVPAKADGKRDPTPFAWRSLGSVSAVRAVRICLGRTRLSCDDRHSLRQGSVVSFESLVEDPVDIELGRDIVGCGRMVIVNGKLAVQVTNVRNSIGRRSA